MSAHRCLHCLGDAHWHLQLDDLFGLDDLLGLGLGLGLRLFDRRLHHHVGGVLHHLWGGLHDVFHRLHFIEAGCHLQRVKDRVGEAHVLCLLGGEERLRLEHLLDLVLAHAGACAEDVDLPLVDAGEDILALPLHHAVRVVDHQEGTRRHLGAPCACADDGSTGGGDAIDADGDVLVAHVVVQAEGGESVAAAAHHGDDHRLVLEEGQRTDDVLSGVAGDLAKDGKLHALLRLLTSDVGRTHDHKGHACK